MENKLNTESIASGRTKLFWAVAGVFAGILITLLIFSIFTIGLKNGENISKNKDYKTNRQTSALLETSSETDSETVNKNVKEQGVIDLNQKSIPGWVTYSNSQIGFSFQYPEELGRLDSNDLKIDIHDEGYGYGKRFHAYFPSLDKRKLMFGGNTADYVPERDMQFTDFAYYTESKNGEFQKIVNSEKVISIKPIKTMIVDSQKVLIVEIEYPALGGYEGELMGPPSVGALINLPNKKGEFKGLAIENQDINAISKEKFEQIISTLKFAK